MEKVTPHIDFVTPKEGLDLYKNNLNKCLWLSYCSVKICSL